MTTITGTLNDDLLIATTDDTPYLMRGLGGDDSLQAGTGVDNLFGGSGDDELIAFNGRDVLRGGRGDDNLFGMFGKDTLFGGKGADTFWFASGLDGGDKIMDFNARDGDKIGINLLGDLADAVIIIEDHGKWTKIAAAFVDGPPAVLAKVHGDVSASDFLFVS